MQVLRHVPVPQPHVVQVPADVPQPVDVPVEQLVHSVRDVPVRAGWREQGQGGGPPPGRVKPASGW